MRSGGLGMEDDYILLHFPIEVLFFELRLLVVNNVSLYNNNLRPLGLLVCVSLVDFEWLRLPLLS